MRCKTRYTSNKFQDFLERKSNYPILDLDSIRYTRIMRNQTRPERDEDRYSRYSILDISVSRVSWRHRRTIIVHCDHVFTVLFLPCLDTQWLKGNDYVTMMSLAKATPPTALPHYAESSTGWVLQNATASLSVHPPLPSTHLCPRIVPRCKKLRG